MSDSIRKFTITAAIPTYKRPVKFRRALESVLGQTESPDTIIVGDDGSDEETRCVVESFRDPRIVYVPRQPKRRMTDNWDFVMRWPRGGLVALLEDDNFWLPHHLANAGRLFAKFPSAGLYHAGHQEAWEENGRMEIYRTCLPRWQSRLREEGGGIVQAEEVVLDALVCGSINSSTVVVRREALDSMPSFDHRYLMGMDTLMWTRMALAYPCICGPELDTIYTYHGENVSTAEISTRRAGRQARAVRRMVLSEALAAGVVTVARLRSFLLTLSPADLSGVLTMMAHPATGPSIRSLAKEVWRKRADARHSTGYMRATGLLGFGLLRHVDWIDRLLSTTVRLHMAGRVLAPKARSMSS